MYFEWESAYTVKTKDLLKGVLTCFGYKHKTG